jgi:hypothetical protein
MFVIVVVMMVFELKCIAFCVDLRLDDRFQLVVVSRCYMRCYTVTKPRRRARLLYKDLYLVSVPDNMST